MGLGFIPVETPGSGDLGSPDFRYDVPWPKLWPKNGVFDQILGSSGHFDVALEKWAPIALKTFYRYVGVHRLETARLSSPREF